MYLKNRLILTSVLLATKYHQDEVHSNKHFSRLGGVSNLELNALEIEFISTVGFESLMVSQETYEMLYKNLDMFQKTLKQSAKSY
jgi:Cyclin